MGRWWAETRKESIAGTLQLEQTPATVELEATHSASLSLAFHVSMESSIITKPNILPFVRINCPAHVNDRAYLIREFH